MCGREEVAGALGTRSAGWAGLAGHGCGALAGAAPVGPHPWARSPGVRECK